VQAELIDLRGSVELASWVRQCDYVVDLIETGRT
jgi:ATP phosphoribosyltransferase